MEGGVVINKQTAGSRHNFPGKTNVEWFERFGGSSFYRGKKASHSGVEQHRGTGSPLRLIVMDPLALGRTGTGTADGDRGSGCVSFQEGFLKTSNVLGKRLRELG